MVDIDAWMREPTEADRQFLAFHEANPIVYATLARLARYARQRGRHRLGVKMLWERMRWELTIETDDATSDYKLNNNYHSRYARLLMETEADLAGMFELRALRS